MARSIALEWRNEEPRDQGQSRDLPKTDAEKRVESKGWREMGRRRRRRRRRGRSRSRDVTLLRFFFSLLTAPSFSSSPFPHLLSNISSFSGLLQPTQLLHPITLFCAFCISLIRSSGQCILVPSLHSFIRSFAIIFHIPLFLHSFSHIGKKTPQNRAEVMTRSLTSED